MRRCVDRSRRLDFATLTSVRILRCDRGFDRGVRKNTDGLQVIQNLLATQRRRKRINWRVGGAREQRPEDGFDGAQRMKAVDSNECAGSASLETHPCRDAGCAFDKSMSVEGPRPERPTLVGRNVRVFPSTVKRGLPPRCAISVPSTPGCSPGHVDQKQGDERDARRVVQARRLLWTERPEAVGPCEPLNPDRTERRLFP